MPLVQLIYKSTTTNQFSESELVSILASSVKNNAVNEITGMLLYREGQFIQVLEGGTTQVNELMWRIKADPRHESIYVNQLQTINSREFPTWSMGFQVRGDSNLVAHPSVIDFFSDSFDSYKEHIRYGTALIALMAFANKVSL